MKNYSYIRLVDFVDANAGSKAANTVATNATNNAASRDYDTATADDDDDDGDDDFVDDDNFLHGLATTTTTTAFDKNQEWVKFGTKIKGLKNICEYITAIY